MYMIDSPCIMNLSHTTLTAALIIWWLRYLGVLGSRVGNSLSNLAPSMLENGTQIKGEHVEELSRSAGGPEDEAIRFNTTKIVVGLQYLGSGYDIVKANTLGDTDQGEDLGYRAPVIDFTWAQTDVGVTNSLDSLQPVGGWVRPKVSCGESENVSEIASINNLKELTEADVGVDVKVPNVGTGALNTQYEALKSENGKTNNKLYTNTYYCFTYAAGMPPTLDWSTTDDFALSLSELPQTIRSYEECTLEAYKKRKEVCADLLEWMEFFSEFGTHVVTEVHLGGKLTRYLSVPASEIESLSKMGYDVNAVVGSVISGISGNLTLGVSEEDESEIKKLKGSSTLQFSVLGGIHQDRNISEASIRKWKSTVPKYPMPIKIEVTSISSFIPRAYYPAFKEAISFYVTLNNALPWDIEQKDGRIMTLKSLLVNSIQVIVTNTGGEIPLAKCPRGKRVLFGFIIRIDKDMSTFVYPCLQQRKFCSVDKAKDDSSVMIYIVCGNSLGLNFEVKYQDNQDMLQCKEGDVIVTGFNISFKEGGFYACNTGESSCKVEHKGSMIIVCVDERLPELKAARTVVNISKNNMLSVATDKYTLIGFVMCLSKTGTTSICEPFSNGCKLVTKEECENSIGWGVFTD